MEHSKVIDEIADELFEKVFGTEINPYYGKFVDENGVYESVNETEKKAKEISEKWKSIMQEQGIEDTYKFYRQNQVELFKDFEELWLLYKLEGLK